LSGGDAKVDLSAFQETVYRPARKAGFAGLAATRRAGVGWRGSVGVRGRPGLRPVSGAFGGACGADAADAGLERFGRHRVAAGMGGRGRGAVDLRQRRQVGMTAANIQASRPQVVSCQSCGQPFTPQRRSARFCSPACRVAAHRARLSVTGAVPRGGTVCALKPARGTSGSLTSIRQRRWRHHCNAKGRGHCPRHALACDVADQICGWPSQRHGQPHPC
jgi:hypothetical protein